MSRNSLRKPWESYWACSGLGVPRVEELSGRQHLHAWARCETEEGGVGALLELTPVPGRAAATPTVAFSFPASQREQDRGRYQVPSQGSCTNWRNRSLAYFQTPFPPAPPPRRQVGGAQSSEESPACVSGYR